MRVEPETIATAIGQLGYWRAAVESSRRANVHDWGGSVVVMQAENARHVSELMRELP